ncbi:MAG: S4 domain-containing protein [Bacteroidales bacterium]
MEEKEKLRIDKFLWAVRIFKTRSQASEACKSGKVIISDIPVKSSRIINIGDVFVVKKNPVIYIFKVKELTENRVGPKLVENYIENQTSAEELQKLDTKSKSVFVRREKGTGRPTKKERRDIDKLYF